LYGKSDGANHGQVSRRHQVDVSVGGDGVEVMDEEGQGGAPIVLHRFQLLVDGIEWLSLSV